MLSTRSTADLYANSVSYGSGKKGFFLGHDKAGKAEHRPVARPEKGSKTSARQPLQREAGHHLEEALRETNAGHLL